MLNHTHYPLIIRSCQAMLFCVVLVIITFFLKTPQSNIKLDTDLKSMSPDIVKDEGIQSAIHTLSQDIEKRFTLVLQSSSAEDVESAGELFFEKAQEQSNLFIALDPLEKLEELKALLVEHRFQLASPSSQEALANHSEARLLANAQRALFGLEGSGRQFSLADDPLGFLNDYLLTSTANQGDIEVPIEQRSAGNTSQFYYPLFFSIRHSALDMDTQAQIDEALSHLKTAIATEFPSVSFLHSGVFFFAKSAAESSKSDISFISFWSSLLIVSMLLMVFRSMIPLLLPLLSVVVGVGFAFVLCHLLLGAVHIITLVFGAGLIGVVIDYALHFYYHHTPKNPIKTHFILLKALFFSLASSMLGYAALAFSDIPSLKHVALFSVIGLSAAWLTVISLGDSLIRHKPQPHDRIIINVLNTIIDRMTAIKPWLITAFLCCTMMSFSLIIVRDHGVSDDPRLFFKADASLLQENYHVSQITQTLEPGTYLVIESESTEGIYQTIEDLGLGSNSNAAIATGIHSWLPSPQEQAKVYQLYERLFQDDGLIEKFLLPLGVDQSIIDAQKNAYRSAANKNLNAEALIRTLGKQIPPLWIRTSDKIVSFILLTKGYDHQNLSHAAKKMPNVHYIHTAEMTSQAIKSQRQSASLLLFFAAAAVALLTLVRYRQLQSLWLVAVPCMAICLTTHIFFVLNIPLTLFHIMAMFLVFGLGMDYVIFVTDLHKDNADTLAAVFLSALTSLISFGLLSLSDLPVVQAFGLTVLIGNSINFIGALLLSSQLPAVLTAERPIVNA